MQLKQNGSRRSRLWGLNLKRSAPESCESVVCVVDITLFWHACGTCVWLIVFFSKAYSMVMIHIFLLLVCTTNMLRSSDIFLGDDSTITADNRQKDLVAVINGNGSHLDLRNARISDVLTIQVTGNNNTVVMKHPNTLKLTVNGQSCRITNLCCASKSSAVYVRGKNSVYEVSNGLKYSLFGSLTNIALTVTIAGMLAFLLYNRHAIKNAI